jgi:hypothetical protein
VLPLLLPLVTNLAPALAHYLFGPKAAEATAQAGQAIATLTGADPATPEGAEAAQAIIASKPDLALQLQTELLRIHAAMQAEADQAAAAQRANELEQFRASLADMTGARAQTVTLAQARSPLAYGAAAISALVLLMFAGTAALALFREMPPGNQTLMIGVLTSLQTMAAGVVSYWCGSSIGSSRKDATLAHLAMRGGQADDK